MELRYKSVWPDGRETNTILKDGLAYEDLSIPGSGELEFVCRTISPLEARMSGMEPRLVAPVAPT